MELRHLRYFDAVARTLHFGRAAEQLHIAQPALSRAVRQLEREVGVTLLHRTTRTVELTDAGRAYVEEVRDVLRRLDHATRAARRAEAGVTGTLRLGVTGTAAYGYLPRVAQVLTTALPQVHLQVHTEMLTPDQERALVGDRLDLGILRPPLSEGGLEHVVVRREPLVLALPAGHPLAASSETDDVVPLAALHGEPFVTYAHTSGSVVREAVRSACREAGFEPDAAHEVGETSTLLALVAAALGVALVPESARTLTLPGVSFRATDSAVHVQLAVAWRRDDPSPVLRSVLQALREQGALSPVPTDPTGPADQPDVPRTAQEAR
ncbi:MULTISPECIES: LysR substrate-binding domain-containing protein [unclassified Ornithinimicrobium]|uniref:LysR substrate-binding domain-containing protein n=1 Tax=unclassified Ornithinimicrobium TaxID=2615080 RepID=UPI003853D6FD